MNSATLLVTFVLKKGREAENLRTLYILWEQVVPPTLRGRHTLDVKEFLKFTVPRQVVFFELGYDCASSNLAKTNDELEKSLYGLMLANTPKAFLHLLNRYFMSFNRFRLLF